MRERRKGDWHQRETKNSYRGFWALLISLSPSNVKQGFEPSTAGTALLASGVGFRLASQDSSVLAIIQYGIRALNNWCIVTNLNSCFSFCPGWCSAASSCSGRSGSRSCPGSSRRRTSGGRASGSASRWNKVGPFCLLKFISQLM